MSEPTTAELRQRFKDAITLAECERIPKCPNCVTDSVLAVHASEVEQLRAELHALRERAEQAENELSRVQAEANRALREQASTSLVVAATGFGKTVTDATGETVLNIKAGDRRIHIYLGTELAEPMGVLLLDDPEHRDS